jgi:broad specificity phosphatase PhoE
VPAGGREDQGDDLPSGHVGTTRTLVHLVRHGEVHNPDAVLYGRLPGYRLSDTGRKQAGLVADALADHDVAAVLSSPLERALETAAVIAEQHDVDVIADDRLIEADNIFEGHNVEAGNGALFKPRYWPQLYNPFRPSWGEPYVHIAHRMLDAVHRARGLASGHEAVCVSHQLPIWTLRRYLEGRRLWHNPRRRQCSLASVTSLEFDDERLVRIVYSQPAGPTDPKVTGA